MACKRSWVRIPLSPRRLLEDGSLFLLFLLYGEGGCMSDERNPMIADSVLEMYWADTGKVVIPEGLARLNL